MKFKAAENSVFGTATIEPLEREVVKTEIDHAKWVPISSSIAESAVNQVVSHRMAKKRQMRWTDEGAHCLAQVRVADLNGEFSSHRILALKIAASRQGKCIGTAS